MITFWEFIVEREAIRVRREEQKRPAPWTDDEILRDYSFTNIRRIHDPDTLYSLRSVAKVARTPHDYLWSTYAYRCLNRGETIDKYGLPRRTRASFRRWSRDLDAARRRREAIGSPVHLTFWSCAKRALGGPFMTDFMLSRAFAESESGVEAVRLLSTYRPALHIGPYVGALIVSDLVLQRKLRGYLGFDKHTTVPIGNGARIGLRIVLGEPPRKAHKLFAERGSASRRNRSFREAIKPDVLDEVKKLSAMSKNQTGLALTFIDIENCLCEYSRYARIAANLDGPWRRRLLRRNQ